MTDRPDPAVRLRTPLCDLLGITHPILLAPMAGVSGGRLAGAVSQAGGLGMIGGGYGDKGWLERELALVGDARFGVGFISWSLARQPELLSIALDRAPCAIMLSFGETAAFLPQIRRVNTKLIVQIQSLDQARQALAEGADVIVAQGTEAGGHGGSRSTMPLVPAVVDSAGLVPVVAAGGIADGRGLAASLMLGAQGVLCGTALYVSDEALVHDNLRRVAIAAYGDNTLRSSVFDVARGLEWPADWNLRTLRNRFTERWSADQGGFAARIGVERIRYRAATDQHDTDIAPVIVGEAIDLVTRQRPAGEIVSSIIDEGIEALRAAAAMLRYVDADHEPK
jgi:nitronate monooxygenase